ncbi:MAG: entericidin [Bacteroidaceae bacterium]|nr:entericidin [Bacteroidaceae bacterium]
MKKILFAAVALVAISFASCNGCAKLDEIQKAADSLSATLDSANAQIEEADSAFEEVADSVEAFVEE